MQPLSGSLSGSSYVGQAPNGVAAGPVFVFVTPPPSFVALLSRRGPNIICLIFVPGCVRIESWRSGALAPGQAWLLTCLWQ
jgi:hypothetical protein